VDKTIVDPEDLRVLILAPTGEDAPLIQRVLTEAGIWSLMCRSLPQVTDTLTTGAGAVLLAQEALQSNELQAFVAALEAQPPWSDLPITVLTRCGSTQWALQKVSEQFQKMGNLTLLERPLHALALTSVLRVALRSRARQYHVRDLVERLTASQIALHEKISDLEQFQDVVVGRELKMMELEKQLEELKDRQTAHKEGSPDLHR
jgi:hypothetical protein